MAENKNQPNGNPKKPGLSGLIFYGVLFALLIGVSLFYFGEQSAATGAGLSDVLEYIENDDYTISSAVVNGTTLTMEYRDEQGEKQKLTQDIPYEYVDELIDELDQARQDGKIESFNYIEPFDWSMIIEFILIAGSIIIVVLIFLNLSRQSKDGNSVFSFGQNRAKRTDPNGKKVKFDDVAGSLEEKEELFEVVDFLKRPKKYLALGAKIPKGVLLFGAPGTGKTLLARAVAGEAGVPFFYISGSDFVEMLVGVGASRVRSLFADAKKASPSVVFIDEIDAVGRKRGAGLGGGNDEREQTLNQILVEMDGFDIGTNVIVIAATNRPDVLDPALLRPGRFDRSIFVSDPDAAEREAILKIHAKGKPLDEDVNLKDVSLSTVGFTGADLENLLNEAALLTARRNKNKISNLEIKDAMFRVMMGPEKNSKKLTDKVKKLTAYHESGHAIVLRTVSDTQKVDRVTIIPAGRAGGYTAYKPVEDVDFYTKDMLLDSIKVALGGRAAEELFLDDITTGASSDLQSCNKLARNMIKKYGLSEKFKNLVFDDENDEVFLGSSFGHVQGYSDETAAAIDAEVQGIIDSCYEEVKRILNEKKSTVEGLATRLIDVYKVDGPEFEKIFLAEGDLSVLETKDEPKDEVKDEAKNEVKDETKDDSTQQSASEEAKNSPEEES